MLIPWRVCHELMMALETLEYRLDRCYPSSVWKASAEIPARTSNHLSNEKINPWLLRVQRG